MTGPLIVDRATSLLGDEGTATFSEDRVYRYALTRTWDPGKRRACFIMLNPSTADAEQLDPTVRRCLGFAQSWNCGSLLVLNIFALRSTDPKALYQHDDPVGPDNDAVIEHELRNHKGPVVCAWGAHGQLYARGLEVTRRLRSWGISPLCLGRTQSGEPKHPLYVRAGTSLTSYGRNR